MLEVTVKVKDYLYDLFIKEAVPALNRHRCGSGGSGGGGASLNIAYGEEPPSDTSKLWCKCEEPTNVLAKAQVDGSESIRSSDTFLSKGTSGITARAIGRNIYLFGGFHGGYIRDIRRFDTETETFTTVSTAVTSETCYDMTSARVGTKIYLFGGNNSSYMKKIQIFDTENETLTTLEVSLPSGLAEITSAVVGTKVYLFGGFGGSSFDTVNVFDTENETINTLSVKLPYGLHAMGVGVVGTKVYLFGGNRNNAYRYNTIIMFDSENWTITTLDATLPATYSNMGSCTIGTKIYLFGGTTDGKTADNKIHVFDANTETLSTLSTTLPAALYTSACEVVGANVYLFGGYDGSSRRNDISIFTLASELETGNMMLQTSFNENVFNIIPGIELGVKNVYIGNAEGKAERVNAYLFNDDKWTLICGPGDLPTTYADMLYEHFGVDRTAYPEILIGYNSNNYSIYFGKVENSNGWFINAALYAKVSYSDVHSDDLSTFINNFLAITTELSGPGSARLTAFTNIHATFNVKDYEPTLTSVDLNQVAK